MTVRCTIRSAEEMMASFAKLYGGRRAVLKEADFFKVFTSHAGKEVDAEGLKNIFCDAIENYAPPLAGGFGIENHVHAMIGEGAEQNEMRRIVCNYFFTHFLRPST